MLWNVCNAVTEQPTRWVRIGCEVHLCNPLTVSNKTISVSLCDVHCKTCSPECGDLLKTLCAVSTYSDAIVVKLLTPRGGSFLCRCARFQKEECCRRYNAESSQSSGVKWFVYRKTKLEESTLSTTTTTCRRPWSA